MPSLEPPLNDYSLNTWKDYCLIILVCKDSYFFQKSRAVEIDICKGTIFYAKEYS